MIARLMLAMILVAAFPIDAFAHRPHHEHCRETSRTLGRRTCTKFGAWSTVTRLPAITSDIIATIRSMQLPLQAGAAPAQVDGAPVSSRESQPSPGRRHVVPGIGLRFTVGLGRHLYTGLGLEGGPILEVAGLAAESDPTVQSMVGLFILPAGVIGARYAMGRSTISAELVSGAMITPVRVSGPEPPTANAPTETVEVPARLWLEGRVRADVWLNPWITAGGFAGVELQGRGVAAGVQLSFHVRAFDRLR